jgi:hypothetical protein
MCNWNLDYQQCYDSTQNAMVCSLACCCCVPHHRRLSTCCQRKRSGCVPYRISCLCKSELRYVGKLFCDRFSLYCGESTILHNVNSRTPKHLLTLSFHIQAAIWYDINANYGANFVSVCLRCIWPSWHNVPNHLPANSRTTTQLLAALAIFWILSLPFIFIHPRNLNWYFVAKSCMVAPACFAVLIWAIVLNGGSVGPSFQVSPKISNSDYYGWLWMMALNSSFGGCLALIVAQADIARYGRKPSDQTWSQLIMYPVFSALPALFGILVVPCTSNCWGKGSLDI